MNKIIFGIVAAAVLSAVIATSMTSMAKSAEPEIGHNAVTVLVGFKRIPAGDFLHLYDSTPHPVAVGHIAVHVDCDGEGKGIVSIALGVAPDLEVIDLTMDNMVHDLSTHGEMCIYHADLPPEHDMKVTDIAIINTGNKDVRLGGTAGVVIHVASFGEAIEHEEHGAEEEHEMEEEHEGGG
jgi:hypothetical protein